MRIGILEKCLFTYAFAYFNFNCWSSGQGVSLVSKKIVGLILPISDETKFGQNQSYSGYEFDSRHLVWCITPALFQFFGAVSFSLIEKVDKWNTTKMRCMLALQRFGISNSLFSFLGAHQGAYCFTNDIFEVKPLTNWVHLLISIVRS